MARQGRPYIGVEYPPGMDRPAGCGAEAEAPAANARGGAGAGQDAAASTGGVPDGAAGAASQGRGGEGGGADGAGMADKHSRQSQGRHILSARERAERVREHRKTKPRYITIRFDPCNLGSKYSEDEIREMIASGEVIEYTTPWRERSMS